MATALSLYTVPIFKVVHETTDRGLQQLSACIGNRLLLQTGFSMCEKRNICCFTQIIPVAQTCKHPKQHEYPKDFQFALQIGCYTN